MSVGACDAAARLALRAAIVDDEPMAREYLKLMLSRVGGVEVVAECASASECLASISSQAAEVVFLDIHLPDQSGVEVAKALCSLSSPPHIVFVTGYDDYAVPAFELAAVDYIMKPFNQARIEETLKRVRARVSEGTPTLDMDGLSSLGKIAIRDKDGCKLVDAGDICFVRTSGRKTAIQTSSHSYLSNYTLGELENRLRGHRFFRANEGCLVNLDRVSEVVYLGPRSYELLLGEPCNTFIPLSRSRAQRLREILDF